MLPVLSFSGVCWCGFLILERVSLTFHLVCWGLKWNGLILSRASLDSPSTLELWAQLWAPISPCPFPFVIHHTWNSKIHIWIFLKLGWLLQLIDLRQELEKPSGIEGILISALANWFSLLLLIYVEIWLNWPQLFIISYQRQTSVLSSEFPG